VIDRSLFLGYRLFVIRVGLVISWFGTMGFVWLANRGPGPMADGAWPEIAIVVAMTTLLTIAPWRRALLGEIGDAYLGIWTVTAAGAVVAAYDLVPGSPLAVAFIVVVVFALATLVRAGYLVVIAASSFGGYAYALDRAGHDLGSRGDRLGLIAFAVTALFAAAASIGVTRVFQTAAIRLRKLQADSDELERRREELDELYAISATIGLGGTLTEIVPVLMGRIVHSVGARVGLVFLFRPDHDDLELISPLWVAGRMVRAEGYTLPLTDAGVVQRVFTSGLPLVSNDPLSHGNGEPLLEDLDTSRIAAVSMAVDGRPIGVLVVADKAGGDFAEADVARLQSLAGPAALVMNQMARYDAAQEMGHKMAELAQLKSDFVSVVSHELRSPLTSIIGSLHTLKRPEMESDPGTTRELVDLAARQADRLRVLIEDLLVASRLDSHALPVRPEATRVDTLVVELLADLPSAQERVSLRVADDLPQAQVDPAHLSRIVRNLVENAMKYAPDGTIEIVAKPSGEQVWLSVIDHGPGIPYELHDHIFQPFTQAQHHETRQQGGTGLGLSIVRGLTEAMGGRVWYEPTVGGGATFTVALPRRTGARQQAS
jgi:signal transduction histidine kinase